VIQSVAYETRPLSLVANNKEKTGQANNRSICLLVKTLTTIQKPFDPLLLGADYSI